MSPVQEHEARFGRIAPDRSLRQRMNALDNANVIRKYRAELKKDVKAGRIQAIDLILNPPEKIDTMKIFDLLVHMPKYGRIKVDKLLRTCRISPSKTVGGMSDRQRAEMVAMLRRRT